MGCGASSQKYEKGKVHKATKLEPSLAVKSRAQETSEKECNEWNVPEKEFVKPLLMELESERNFSKQSTTSCVSKHSTIEPEPERNLSKQSTISRLSKHSTVALEVAVPVGEALLGLCEEIPFVAPVAVLLGAVVKCTTMVKTLRADAQKFAALLGSVESLLEQAAVEGTLPEMKPVVERLHILLEESLAHCQKLTQSYWAIAAIMGPKDLQKFKALQTDITQVCSLITMAASTSAARLLTMQFDESDALSRKVAELGGPLAVAGDPDKVAEIEGLMSTSDAVVLAAVRRVDEQAEAIRTGLFHQLELQEQQAMLQAKVMSAQIENLTTMLQAVLAKKGGEVTQESVKDVIDRMPVPADEPARLKVLEDLGLMGDEVIGAVGDPELERMSRECMAEFELTFVNIQVCDIDHFTSLVFIIHMPDSAEARLDGLRFARMCTICQHTVARAKVHTKINATEMQLEDFGEVDIEESSLKVKTMMPFIETLAGAGQQAAVELGALVGQLTQGAEECVQDNGFRFASASLGAFFHICKAKGTCLKSMPLRVRGQPIGVLCVAGGAKLADVPHAALEAKYNVAIGKHLLARVESVAKQWSCDDVGSWLKQLGLQQYAEAFSENGVDGVALLEDVGEQDLTGDLGVKGLHAKKLLREINKLRSRDSKQ